MGEIKINTDTHLLIFFIITVIGLVAVATVYPLWMVLHYVLCKRLDPILFKEPYFQKSELLNYLCWPLSCLRSLNYIFLIAAPSIAKRKRFRGLGNQLSTSKSVVVACKVQIFLMVVLAIFFFVFFGYGGTIIYFDL